VDTLFRVFCRKNNLYTLYVNLPNAKTLASHKRLRGEHYNGAQGRDFEVAQHVDVCFPQSLSKYGWEGRMLPPIDGTSTLAEVSILIRQDSSPEIHHALEAVIQQMQATRRCTMVPSHKGLQQPRIVQVRFPLSDTPTGTSG